MGLLNAPAFEEADDPSVGATPLPTLPPLPLPTPQVSSTPKATTMATLPASTKFVTGVVRGSYLYIFSPRATDDGKEPKYQMTILIPKTDTATVAKIKAAQEAAVIKKWPSKRPAKIESTMHDGDGPRPSSGEPFGPECAGHWVMAVSSKFKPQVVNRNRDEVIDPQEAMSGDYFKVSLNFYGYDSNGKKGVSAGLGNVLVWDKGEPLGGTSRADDDFSDDFVAP